MIRTHQGVVDLRLKGETIAHRFKLGQQIGKGAFGNIHIAYDTKTKEHVAIKLEDPKIRVPQVLREAKILKVLGLSSRSLGIPRIIWSGKTKEYNVMAMELLGESLEHLFNFCGRQFSLKTVLMLTHQILKRLQFIHSKNFIHRDIKPDNFLMGRGKRRHIVYLLDFGLSKKYRDSRGIHIGYRDDKHLTGTARYASINNHLGIEQSRRDDLESVCNMLVYFLKGGKLPWMGLKAKGKKDKYNKICDKKTSTPISVLCNGVPIEFAVFLQYTRSLAFEDRPDYEYCRKLFTDLFKKNNYRFDYIFDWDIIESKRKNQEKLENKIKKRKIMN